MKNIRVFLSENFHFLVVKFSSYLNRHVFVMNFISIMVDNYIFLFNCMLVGRFSDYDDAYLNILLVDCCLMLCLRS